MTYPARQRTLSRLSLVSHRFKEIAQPLLFETLWISSSSIKLRQVLDVVASKGWKSVVRALCISRSTMKISEVLEESVKMGGGLRALSLNLRTGSKFGLTSLHLFPSTLFGSVPSHCLRKLTLSQLADLETLQLFGPLSDCTTTVVLRKLHAATLDYAALESTLGLLNPSSLPALRILSFVGVEREEDVERLVQSNVKALVPQLESLLLPITLIDIAPDFFVSAFERTLFDYYPYVETTFSPLSSHLRIMGIEYYPERREVVNINRLTTSIQTQDPIHLRSLYLDASLDPISTSPLRIPAEVFELVCCCEEKKVEVIYEEQPRDWAVDSYISHEFCGRQRRIREVEEKDE